MANRPRLGYYFRCGEVGHLADVCDNAANPPKVEEKRYTWREQQAQWASLHENSSLPLN